MTFQSDKEINNEKDRDFSSNEEEYDSDEDENISESDWGDKKFLGQLDSVLKRLSLHDNAIIDSLASSSFDDERWIKIINELVASGAGSTETVKKLLKKWKENKERVSQYNEKTKTKKAKQGLVAIWRCAVCRRADLPYIACTVAPFIVRYDRKNL